ncbi:Cytochrome P450 monooxygenase yanH [Colletotrichum sidae]|uniref:Cytochrome P450 monooxygenase yanH n=1 Tax=Colletotrichum sidae TaxID=1347389 RepID=A0A4R8T2D8_9PEZI|nr:Cytochrome P450 monooxygenase yanH [Colletotrichum sidae]
MDVYDTVHKVNSGFVKDPRNYGEFVQDGHPALFSITHPDEHAKRRRILGQLYSRSKMSNLEELMLQNVDNFVHAIRQKFETFDAGSACRALEADIISHFSFGEALNAVVAWSRDEEVAIVSMNDKKATLMPLWTYDAWTRNKLPEKPTTSQNPNLVRVMIAAGVPSQTALSEAKENLGPGTDTTSASLAHVLYALAQNQAFQHKVYRDLADLGFPTDMASLENIPRLKACVKEGVRWAGAAAAMLPRVVPKGGVELCGKFLPGGTVLTSSPNWYLRDKHAFPSPELFDPYRWVDESGTSLKEDALRDKFYIPFSKGANICIGLHFSYYELYISLARILQNFEIVSPNDPESHAYGHDWKPVTLPKRQEWWVLAKYIHSYNDYRLVCECAELVDQLFLGGHLTRPSTRYRQRFGLSMEHVEVEITQGNERCGGRWPSHSALMSRGSGLAPFVLIDVDTKHATCVPEVLEAIVHELAHAYIAVFGCTENLCKFDVARGSSGGLHRGPVHSLLVYIFGEMRSWFVDVPQLRSFGLRYELGCNSPPGIQVITVVEVFQTFIHCCELVREKLCDE